MHSFQGFFRCFEPFLPLLPKLCEHFFFRGTEISQLRTILLCEEKPWSCLAVGLARWRTSIFTECWGDSVMRCLLYPGIVWLPLIILDPFLGLCESVSTSIYYVNLLKKSSIITGIGEVFASASDKIIMRDATLAHPMLFSSHFHWFWAHCFNYPGQFVQQ